MGALNELIAGVKFIKLFAWEEKWIEKVMEKRKEEVGWIVQSESLTLYGSVGMRMSADGLGC